MAALFIIFAGITRQLGVQYSRFSPLWCEYPVALGFLFVAEQSDLSTDSRIFLTAVNLLLLTQAHHSLSLIAHSQDIVALVVQAAGGGLAATASTQSGSNLVSLPALTLDECIA